MAKPIAQRSAASEVPHDKLDTAASKTGSGSYVMDAAKPQIADGSRGSAGPLGRGNEPVAASGPQASAPYRNATRLRVLQVRHPIFRAALMRFAR